MEDLENLAKVELERMVEELGLVVVGSGADGNVLKQDLVLALESAESALQPREVDVVETSESAGICITVSADASVITITEGPIQNETFEPGQSYNVPADWWRILGKKRTRKGELYFKKEN